MVVLIVGGVDGGIGGWQMLQRMMSLASQKSSEGMKALYIAGWSGHGLCCITQTQENRAVNKGGPVCLIQHPDVHCCLCSDTAPRQVDKQD